MRKNFFAVVVVSVVAVVASYNVYQSKETALSNLVLADVEALAEYESPDFVITCDGGSSGSCFAMEYQEGLYGACYFSCNATGSPDDYCSGFYVDFVNFCSSLGG